MSRVVFLFEGLEDAEKLTKAQKNLRARSEPEQSSVRMRSCGAAELWQRTQKP